ncbi:MAG: penicillin acylase family protein [Terriglobales bacterium]
MSVTSSFPEVHSRSWVGRSILIVVLLVVLLAAAAAGWAYWIARAALPQVDGAIVAPGLSAKVRVLRDELGVPTIEAATLEDLFFAQGYVTAQDRLWQMDITRRAAAGELSEIIGEDTLKVDREQRILGLRGVAEASERNLSARDRSYLEAYTRGVNALMEARRDHLPIEFLILKYQPRPWTITDSLLVGALLVEELNHYSYARALTREKVLAKIGPELTADLYVNSSWRDRPPTEVRRGMDEDPGVDGDHEDDEEEVEPQGGVTKITSAVPVRLLPWRTAGTALQYGQENSGHENETDVFRPGSNNWVISGQHTTTGKPLLSNDMHLDHQMPNLWFEARLKTETGTKSGTNAGAQAATPAADFDVAGVTLPGVPFVVVGHNQRMGWGFTNVGPTVEDDYVEEFNAQGQYKTPKGWLDPQHRQEIIHVKGKPDVTLDVVTTRHGPIITDLVPGETRKIALRWTVYDGMALPFFDLDRAQNWDEFRKPFSTFTAAGQNVMYADIDGNIGYQATGRIPIRAAGDGSLPVNGSDDGHEWKGYIPFDDMPRVYDPPEGILATITPDNYKYSISTEWDGPWRTDRIYRVLESGKKFAPVDMLALQMDVSSTFDRLCADKFLYALDHAPNLSPRAKKAADILRDWDGRMSADSPAPTIETNARHELVRMLLEPKLGAAPESPAAGSTTNAASEKASGALNWKSYSWSMSTVWLENVLSKQPERWLPPGYSDYGSLLTAATENALKKTGVPSDLTQWKWGDDYVVEIKHPVLSQLPLIGRFTGPGRHPLSGDNYTVKAGGHNFGASERATWNFANFDQSTLNVVTGESGVFLSPHYMDQWNAWYGGSTFVFPFSESAVEKHRAHEMTLLPK